jgi:hypothetical protein
MEMRMYKLGTIREWKTQNFHVIVDAVEETDLDLSWDEDGSTRQGLENDSLIAFCARVRVFLRGLEVSSDYLGNCVYKSLEDFMDHKECAAQQRKMWRNRGRFNIYSKATKSRLKPRGFATRERAEQWAQKHASEPYDIFESVCGSYFAGMVRTVISEARKEVSSIKDVRVRQEVS